ncbi:MAG: DNA topoisomerase III [Clostridia bacterium]|nr:DNA topoisomerase III [Clostridia bacterium]
MKKTLVLAEKPSVGKELARVLKCSRRAEGCLEGENYIVTWALGHLVTLAEPEEYDKKYEKWNILDLPMLPENMRLKVIPETSKQFRVVRDLMKRADVVDMVIATDSGREGELVARWIMIKAGWNKPTKRLWVSSQTDKAIKEGFQNLRPASEYDNLFKSAQARSQADWLVGLNVTRALTCRFNAQLSAGRVQTPTLALVVEREKEIRSFTPKPYWAVTAAFDGFSATRRDAKNSSRIYDQQTAEAIRQKAMGSTGTVTDISSALKKTPPPQLYDLTELQRDANKKYAYSAKETLDIMQALYERHKALTYPRTDSRYVTGDVANTFPERLKAVAYGQYRDIAKQILANRPINTSAAVNASKVTDHHAIIPTEEPVEPSLLTGPEKNIYDLVVRRFLAIMLPAFAYEEVKLTIDIAGDKYTARGKTVKSVGWKAAYGASIIPDDENADEDDDREQAIPALKKGDKLKVRDAKLAIGKTTPPARYTEATLLYAMEHPNANDRALNKILAETKGLGTPATRADIIEKLFNAFYMQRTGKEISPTSKGIQLIGLAPSDLRSATLTAQWEDRLALIASGADKDFAFIKEIRSYATKLVNEVKASTAQYIHDNQTRTPCPECGKLLLSVKGKKGDMLVCPDRECGYRMHLTQTTNARCPNCFKKMELRGEGDKQMFACVCGYREKLSAFKERRANAGAGKRDVDRYMREQKSAPLNQSMADQLKKWMEADKK